MAKNSREALTTLARFLIEIEELAKIRGIEVAGDIPKYSEMLRSWSCLVRFDVREGDEENG